jgi:hypothetical protein
MNGLSKIRSFDVRISEAMKFVLLIISNFAFSSDVQASGSVFTGCIEFPLERGVLQSLAAVLFGSARLSA